MDTRRPTEKRGPEVPLLFTKIELTSVLALPIVQMNKPAEEPGGSRMTKVSETRNSPRRRVVSGSRSAPPCRPILPEDAPSPGDRMRTTSAELPSRSVALAT